jgi:threonine synthase
MTNQIIYQSTNRAYSQAQTSVNFQEALFQGLAKDEGLFVPNYIPKFSTDFLNQLRGRSYAEVAFAVLNLFLHNEIPASTLKEICQSAYNFTIPIESLPLQKLSPSLSPPSGESKGAWDDKRLFIARLDQGPTASFKDFAARFMARAMQFFKPKEEKLTVLVATSGDTGGAVGEAFKGLTGTQVFILYPTQEVSPIQKKQLDTIGDNVQAIAIEGKFDDCQNFVKKAFADPDLASLRLSSANSINIGRVLPQVVYYVYIYLQVSDNQEDVIFCIPSGNLGNSLGCEIARRMGTPIKKIIIGTNENKAFPVYLQKGDYQKISPSINCISNAMNVGNPSNLARYFELFGGNVDKNGIVHQQPDWSAMQAVLSGYYVSDEATKETMRAYWQKYQVLLEPHGAVGLKAWEMFMTENPDYQAVKTVCIETAHPAKFTEMMEEILEITPQLPSALADMMQRPEKVVYLENNYEVLKDYLLKY